MPNFNGVHARTGAPLVGPLDDAALAAAIARTSRDHERWLQQILWRAQQPLPDPHRQPVLSQDHDDLEKAGWALVVPAEDDGRARFAEAQLDRLLQLRFGQTGRRPNNRLVWPTGFRAEQFLAHHHVNPSQPTDRNLVPYYLLLVASPDQIPFEEQSQLDPQYAVGRLWFDDPSGYRHYANAVLNVEERRVVRPHRLTLFGPENEGDAATSQLVDELLLKLASRLSSWHSDHLRRDAIRRDRWDIETVIREHATKSRLQKLLGGPETPAILFTGSHGLGFDPGDAQQLARQGALLTQEWKPKGPAEVPPDHFFSAADLSDGAQLAGVIPFLFGCYTGGCPERDNFVTEDLGKAREIAPKPFVSALVQRLLSHPEGTALAVIAHVDRAWSSSFGWVGDEGQVGAFGDALQLLLEGHRVGWATERINQSYATMSTYMHSLWCARDQLLEVAPAHFHRVYTATQDLGNFLLFGDPAVRAAVRA